MRLPQSLVVLITVCATCSGYCQIVKRGAPPPERVEMSQAHVSVAMATYDGRPVVEVAINGRGPFRVVLDTGAGGTVLTEELANEIGIASMGQAMLGRPGSDQVAPGTLRHVEKITIGAVELGGVFAVSTDLGSVFQGPDAPGGILSVSAFQGLVVTLNYPKSTVEFSKESLPDADAKTVFDWPGDEPLPTARLQVNGVEVLAHIDSGSAAGLQLPTSMIPKLTLAAKPEPAGIAKSVGSETKVLQARLIGNVTLGQYTFADPVLRFHESNAAVGNIGFEWLKDFAVSVEPGRHRFRLTKATRTSGLTYPLLLEISISGEGD